MKKYFLSLAILCSATFVLAQADKKPIAAGKPPTPSDINKMLEEEMKGMSPEEKAEMRKMMKGVMPALQ